MKQGVQWSESDAEVIAAWNVIEMSLMNKFVDSISKRLAEGTANGTDQFQ
jgi:hypothetical protein